MYCGKAAERSSGCAGGTHRRGCSYACRGCRSGNSPGCMRQLLMTGTKGEARRPDLFGNIAEPSLRRRVAVASAVWLLLVRRGYGGLASMHRKQLRHGEEACRYGVQDKAEHSKAPASAESPTRAKPQTRYGGLLPLSPAATQPNHTSFFSKPAASPAGKWCLAKRSKDQGSSQY